MKWSEEERALNQQLQGTKEEAYWLNLLAKPLPVLELPTDFVRPDVQTYKRDSLVVTITNGLCAQLRGQALQAGVSLQTMLLSAYVMLMNTLTQNDDIIVGIAAQSATDALAIRVQFNQVQSLRQLVDTVNQQVSDAYENSSYPLDLLVKKVGSPVFSTSFLFNQQQTEQTYSSQSDVSAHAFENEEGLNIGFEFNADLYSKSTIHRFAGIYLNVIQSFISNITDSLTTLDFLTEEDRALYALLNNTAVDYDLNQLLHSEFVKQAQTHPERIALSYNGEKMTYGELHERSNQLAHFLRQQGIGRNQFVGIMVERSFEMMVGLYGILKSGAAYVPIDPEYPAQRIQYMINDFESPILLSKSQYAEQIDEITSELSHLTTVAYLDEVVKDATPSIAGKTLYTWHDIAEQPNSMPSIVNEPTDLCYMIYTSGSTGQPKGTQLQHRAVVNFLTWMQEHYTLVPEDVMAQRTSFCFDASIWELFFPLRAGASLAIISSETVKAPDRLFNKMVDENVTVAFFVPSLFTAFAFTLEGMDASERAKLNLRLVLCCGEALQQKPVNLWYDLYPMNSTVVNLYGPTEAAVAITGYICEGKQEQNISIGKPMGNVQVYILDPQGRVCPVGVAGELHIGGVQLAAGYHNKPDKTAEAFIPNHLPGTPGDVLYKTGDLVRLLPNGYLEYISRIDNQVKVRGYRIELGEIEDALSQHPDVEMAIVVTPKGPDGNYMLFGFYTTTREDLQVAELREYIGQKLPDFMVPARLQKVDAIPLGQTGKADRKALVQLATQDDFASTTEYVAPSTATEETLVAIWSDVLKRERIGINDNFFELGGHSLLAMQIFNRLQKQMSVKVELKDLFAQPTVKTLAVYVDKMIASGARFESIQIPAAPAREHYELSNSQKRLWFLYRFDPTNKAYNLPMNFIMQGTLDVAAFEQAVQYLVMRHPSLRTVFIEVDGSPRQMIRSQSEVRFYREDLSDQSRDEQLSYIATKVRESENVPFDLTTGPLMRTMLFTLSDSESYFYLNMHHIITDGWSHDVFMNELSASYDALRGGAEPNLEPLPIQYVDYAEWQGEQGKSGQWSQEEEYWVNTLAKPLPVLELPTDFDRPEVQTYNGDLLVADVPQELYLQLRALAKQEDVSTYMLLLSIYVMLLHSLSQNDDIIVGTPIAGRTVESLEPMIGFFVNNLAIRTRFEGVNNLQDLLQVVKRQALDAYANQTVPFDLLIEKINPERDTSRPPIFSTMFWHQDEARYKSKLADLDITMLLDEIEHSVSMYDMILTMIEGDDSLRFSFEYNTDLFKQATIKRFAGIMIKVVAAFVNQFTTPIRDLDLLVEEDLAVYDKMNDTAADYDLSRMLHEAFIEQAEAHPDRIALSYEGEKMTYGELHERSNQLAHFLRQKGVQRNQYVALLTERSLEMFVGLYAILKAGAAYVPIDPDYPAQRVQYMISDSSAPVLLSKKAYVEQITEIAGDVDSLGTVLYLDATTQEEVTAIDGLDTYVWSDLAEMPQKTPALVNEPTDLCYMIYTSGSTGQPKGVRLPHQAVVNSLTWMQESYHLVPGDVVAQRTSFCFDTSVWELWWPLREGASIAILSTEVVKDPSRLYSRLAEEEVTVVNFVPSLFAVFGYALEGMTPSQREQLKIRWVLLCGEPVVQKPVNLWYDMFSTGSKIVNLYGPTEAAIAVTGHILEGKQETTISIGTPKPNVQMYVLDPSGKKVPVGVPGELHLGGVQLADGYHNKPDKTDEAFIPNHLPGTPGNMLYKTGDLVRVMADGNIEYISRIDNQVKVRGYRIELGEIEEALSQHPDVELAIVVTPRGADGNYNLFGFYTTMSEGLEASDLREFLAERLPEYMVPGRLQSLESMPLAPNGKADRKALSMMAAQDSFALTREYIAPSTPTQMKLAAVWSEFLKREQISANDNFFELGGHSLLAMQIFNRIQQELKAKVELKDLFKHPTLQKLADHLDDMLHSGKGKDIIQISRSGQRGTYGEHYGLSNAQQRLWFLHKFNPTSQAYYVPMHFILNGPMDVGAFDKALQFLIMRHFALRTVFIEMNGVPRQVVTPNGSTRLVHEDLSTIDESEQRSVVKAKIRENEEIPFDLRQGPLLRVMLFTLSHEESYLYVNMHHIITDAWSNEVFIKDLTDIYRSIVLGDSLKLATIEHQYVDYAEWQIKELKNGRWDEEEEYWLNTLAKPLPVLELPADFPRPEVQTFNGELMLKDVPQELSDRLYALARQEGVSLYMLMFATYMMLLRHLTHGEDIIVGTPVAGRSVESLEPIMGMFVNTLAIRVRFEGVTTLRDLLHAVKQEVLGAHEHQWYPFDLLIEKVNPDRDTSRTPIFSSVFLLEKQTLSEIDVDQLQFRQLLEEEDYAVSKFDLTAMVLEHDDCLKLGFEYNTDLFREETVDRFMNSFIQVMEAFINHLTTPINSIELLSDADREAVAQLNDTAKEYPSTQTIHELFYEQAVKHPDRIALTYQSDCLTYRELNERSNQVAHMLRERGVKPNEIVAVMMDRGMDIIVGLLGVLKAGAAYASVDPNYPEDRIRYMLEDSEARVMVVQKQFADRLPEFVRDIVCIEEIPTETATSNVEVTNQPEDSSCVIYTSGSTGRPKGTQLMHRGVVNFVYWMRDTLGYSEQDTVMSATTFSFDASVMDTFGCLLNGAKMHILSEQERYSPEAIADAIEQSGGTRMFLTTSLFVQFTTFLSEADYGKIAKTMKTLLTGGEALLPEVVRSWQRRFGKDIAIVNGYGPTETTIYATSYLIDELLPDTMSSTPIGKPLTNYQVYVLDNNMHICPVGIEGELHIGGVGVGKGYWKQPEKTEEVFIPDPFSSQSDAMLYKTGDLVRLLSNGNIEYVSRKDDQVKVRGFRIEMGEIIEVMLQHPDVQLASVVVKKAVDGTNSLYAYFTSAREDLEQAELKEFLGQKLPEFMVPTRILKLDKMPLNPNGKIERKVLAQYAADDVFEVPRQHETPITLTEEKLAAIWSEILRKGPISRKDNFFDLGGHSLLASQIFNRIQREFRVTVELKKLFAYSTLEKLASYVDELVDSGKAQDQVRIFRTQRQKHYELSSEQRRLWFLYKFDPNSTSYNVPVHYAMEGKLNVAAFEQALQYLVMRHESLRTIFIEVDETPRQTVKIDSDVHLKYGDLSAVPETKQLAYIRAQIDASERVPFSLTEGPLMRAMLFTMGAEKSYFYMNMHHIITDGWSMDIFMKELSDVYNQLTAGQEVTLPPLALQYVDYAVWQDRKLKKGDWHEEEDFWLTTLAKPLPILELPTDYTRPEVQTQNGDLLFADVPNDLVAQLQALAKTEDVSMNMLMFSAYTMLLNTLTQSEDIIVGTAVAGRNLESLESIFGFFVNTLAIRTRFEGVETLRDLLQVVKTQMLDAYAYQSYPFDVLIDKVNPQRDTSRTPIFSTMFNYLNLDWLNIQMGQVQLKQVPVMEHSTSKFDLTLDVEELNESLRLTFEYNTDLFKKRTVERFAAVFRNVLQAFATQLTEPISSLNWLIDEDQEAYAKLNDSLAKFPAQSTIHELFYQQVAMHADRIAVSDQNQCLTFEELNKRSNQVAHLLREQGVGVNEIVAVMMDRGVDLVVTILGVIKAGGAYVPVDPNYPEDRIRYMLEDSGSRLLLTQQHLADRIPALSHEILFIEEISTDLSTENLEITNKAEDLAYVIYTSGSTGRPKGTLLSHVGVSNLTKWMQDDFGYTPDDRVLQFASYSFDASVWETFTTLLNGASLHLLTDIQRQSVDAFADAVEGVGATAVLLPTVFFKQLATYLTDEQLGKLATMKTIFVGGEALPAEMVRAWQRRFGDSIRIVNAYGPTEATVIATVHAIPGLIAESQLNIPIGGSIPNTEIFILNRWLQPCSVNVVGEICIGGVGLAKGYLNQADKTAEAFVPHPFAEQPGAMLYKTGDMARLLPDGTIEYVGRRDSQVKIRGFRIEIGEIEEVLLQHSEVETAAVIAHKGVDGNYSLVAYYTATVETLESLELKQFMSEKLSDYMVPSLIHRIDSMPLSPSGKVDRKALAQLAEQGAFSMTREYEAPATATEEKLAVIWSKILKSDQIGRQDDFFELGGHSLLATQVFNRIQKDFEVSVQLKSLFSYSTLEKLAGHVDELKSAGQAELARIDRVAKKEHYALSNAQKRLWFLYKFDPTSRAYDIPLHHVVKGKLDVAAFEQALQYLIMRHDSLRTVFIEVNEVPRQMVKPESNVVLVHENVSLIAETEQRAYIEQQIKAHDNAPFSLTEGPLVRAMVFTMSEEQSYFYINLHHIITDGWSMERFMKELSETYLQFAQGKTPELAPLEIQYVDYAEWQEQQLESGSLYEQDEAFWLETLAKPLPVLELPTDFARPEVATQHGAMILNDLPEEFTVQLRTGAKQADASVYMLSLAAYVMLLNYLTQNDDIIVGTPSAGRNVPALEPVVGFFVNSLPIRARLEEVQTLQGVLQIVKRQVLDADAHQSYPFDVLIDKVKPDRDTSRSPIFSTMFTFEAAEWSEKSLGDLRLETVEDTEHSISKFDLTLVMVEEENGYKIGFEYNTDLFKSETITRFIGMYLNVLIAFLNQLTAPITSFDWLPEADRTMYELMNDTQVEFPGDRTIHDLFYEVAAKHADQIAVSDASASLTYQELNERSNQVAHQLRERGVGTNQIVAIMMDRGVEIVVALLGVMKAGGAYVPVDPTYPEDRIRYMLEDSGSQLLLTQQALLNQLPELSHEIICIDQIDSGTPTENLAITNKATDLAYVIYTSGSTGRPKGTLLTHTGVPNLSYTEPFRANEQDTVLQFASFSFDASIAEVFPALLNGARLHILTGQERQSIEVFANVVNEVGGTMVIVPTVFFNQLGAHLPDEDIAKLATMRQIMAAGEALQAEVVRAWQRRFGTDVVIVNGYGPTESTVCATTFSVKEQLPEEQLYVPIGTPINNTQVYILNRWLQPCSVNVVGELCIGSVGLANGYHNQPEKTAEAFIPHPFSDQPGARLYKTGDLARLLPDGTIEFIGRRDHQVKVRGFRIEIGEIEEVVLQHPAVEVAAVIAHKGIDGNYVLLAFYTEAEAETDGAEIKSFLGDKLPDYMVPTRIQKLDIMPLTPNGKVDRKVLAQFAADDAFISADEYVAPTTATEEKLAVIWSAVLKREQVGKTHNFFELGGHSLLATQVFNRIQKEFGVTVELKNLFTYATLEKLAAHVDELVGAGQTTQMQILVAEKQERYPVSNAQKRLWFLYKFDQSSPAYNMPMHYVLQGALDTATFEAALQYLIMRHDSLRTVFTEVDEMPYQVIQSDSGFRLLAEDVSGISNMDQRAFIQGQIKASESVPFNLTEGPLMRAMLFRMSEEQSYLYLNMHHIITDGWSIERLTNELSEVYSALEQGRSPELAPLELQYVDYAVWQTQEIESGTLSAKDEVYWLNTLAKPLPVLELPTDFLRPDVQTYSGDLLSTDLPQDLAVQLKAIAKQQGVSMYMVSFAAYVMLLHNLTQNGDIIVGVPVAGRVVESLEPIVGMFVNTLAIRTRFDGVNNLQDLLQVVKGQVLDANAHQSYPFDLLIDRIKPDRDTSRSPIFSAMFNYLAFDMGEKQLGSVTLQPATDVEYSVSKTDMAVSMEEIKDGLRFAFEYNTDLFKKGTVERFAKMYQLVLQAFATQLTVPLRELDLLTEEDNQMYAALNDTETDYGPEQLLHDAFVQQAEAYPDRIVLSYEGETMTYGELHERSNQLAHFLRQQGIGRNQFVGIMVERSFEMMVGLYGILKSGAAYVPIDPEYPAQRIQYMINDFESPILLSKSQYAEQIDEITSELSHLTTVAYLDEVAKDATPAIAGKTLYMWHDVAEHPKTMPAIINEPTDLCYMIYTSGSTGQPKGTQLQHRAVVNFLSWMQEQYPLVPEDVMAQRTSFCFDASIWELFFPLRAGASLAIISTETVKSPDRLFNKMVEENVSAAFFVPSLFTAFGFTLESMAASERSKLQLRWVYCCGEALQPKSVNLWYELYPTGSTVVNLYGPTEAAVAITGYVCVGQQEQTISIGKPMGNVQVYILDPQGRRCPVGVAGELHIGGVQLAAGYHNKPDKTAEAFIPNHLPGTPGDVLYKTGDLVRLLPNGYLDYISRIDNQVKLRGYRIEMGEIEEVLAKHPEIELTVTIVDRGADGSGRLISYYTTVQGTLLETEEIRGYAAEKLPDYMVPSWFIHLQVMPLNPNGKIDRKALPKLDLMTQSDEYVAPRTELEQRIHDVWAQSMRLEHIGVHDSFFQIGGDSIASMQVVARLNQAGLALKISDLFKYQTIADLAGYIEANGLFKELVLVSNQTVTGEQPLSHVQKRFFATKMDHEHFLAPVTMDVAKNVNPDLMQQAIQTLVDHHDMLRATFIQDEAGIKQVLRTPEEVKIKLEVFDLSNFDGLAITNEYQRITSELVAGMNFGEGILMKAALFRFHEHSYRVFWAINHMIDDVVSLGVLQQDLIDVYEKLEHGKQPTLPNKGMSYAEWTKFCAEFINSKYSEAAFDYWKPLLENFKGSMQLPMDNAGGTNRVCDLKTVALTIDKQTTALLRGVVGNAYGMQLNEILMSAIMRAVAKWSGRTKVGLTINGHGRDQLREDVMMDLSRTVGAFTNTYPVYASISAEQSLQETAEQVRARLKAMPQSGVSFSMLNFLSSDASVQELFNDFHYPEVFFNFHGSVMDNASSSEWSVVKDFSMELPEEHDAFYQLAVLGYVEDSSLTLNIAYSNEQYRWETIEQFVKAIEAEVKAFVGGHQEVKGRK